LGETKKAKELTRAIEAKLEAASKYQVNPDMIRELSISLKKCEERIDSMAAYEDIEAMN